MERTMVVNQTTACARLSWIAIRVIGLFGSLDEMVECASPGEVVHVASRLSLRLLCIFKLAGKYV
jgi:hypothetical protein